MNSPITSVRRRSAAVATSAVLTAVLLPAIAGGATAQETERTTGTAQPSVSHEWSESEAAEYAGTFANKDRAYEAYLESRSHWEQAAARVAAGDRSGTLPSRPARVVRVSDTRPWGLATVGFAGILVGLLAAALTGRVRRTRSRTVRPGRIAPA
ncbi:MAG TPA: hypothetical protein VH857_07785 [Actinomycetes bacterium]|jgi:hypothetical protein|nr:hypothetical protein [Actinomycetes bacterium]